MGSAKRANVGGPPIRKSSANLTFPRKLGIIRVSIFHPPCFSAELLSGLPAVVPGLWPGSGRPHELLWLEIILESMTNSRVDDESHSRKGNLNSDFDRSFLVVYVGINNRRVEQCVLVSALFFTL